MSEPEGHLVPPTFADSLRSLSEVLSYHFFDPEPEPLMLSKILAYLQQLVAADKAPLIAAALAGISLLAARFGFHLNASVTAYIGVLLTALAGAFTHAHFAAKSASDASHAALVDQYKRVLGKHEASLESE